MKKILLALAVMMVTMPSMAAKNDERRATATICEGKSSAENFVRTLSDYELARSMLNVMADARLASFKSAHEVGVWVQDQPDCAVWAPGMYFLEVKWLYSEAVSRGLTSTINKIGHGLIRWNAPLERLEERQGERWISWTPYMK